MEEADKMMYDNLKAVAGVSFSRMMTDFLDFQQLSKFECLEQPKKIMIEITKQVSNFAKLILLISFALTKLNKNVIDSVIFKWYNLCGG